MSLFEPPSDSKDHSAYLKHILKAIDLIQSTYCGNLKNPVERLAIERCFEIIGEATAKLSDEIKALHPYIAWRDIKDMRNVIAHGYFGVSTEILQIAIEDELPILKEKIIEILASLQP